MTVINKYDKIKLRLDIFLGIIGILSLILFFWVLGFQLDSFQLTIIRYSVLLVTLAYIGQEAIRWFLQKDRKKYLRERWLENILAIFLIIDLLFPQAETKYFQYLIPGITSKQATLLYLGIIQFVILFAITIKALRYNYLITNLRLHPGAIFAISFALIIIIGTALLLLPNSTPYNKQISFVDALFTSTSAVCVTGLVVVDTAKDFTIIGKTIILFLIQIGGLGVMTLTTFFAVFISGGVSFKFRIMMKDLLSPDNLSQVGSLLFKIFTFTIVIELIGAIIIYQSYGGSLFDLKLNLIYHSIFHSVSAFCNAGFSTYSSGLTDPSLNGNYLFFSTIMGLIVLGGLGFIVLSNLTDLRPKRNEFRRLKNRLSVGTKIVLISTVFLIVGGTLVILFFESYSFDKTLSFTEKIYHALFLAVTTRTAGFNIAPMTELTPVVIVILLPLMWIGASPGSTGGGIKTTTMSIAFMTLINLMRGRNKVELFNREISQDSIKKAFIVILSSVIFLGIAVIFLIWVEPGKEPLKLIFESVSALGTVGLSLDITSSLGTGGKVIIILLMFIGRIGVLTFFLAFVRYKTYEEKYTLPKTDIIVG